MRLGVDATFIPSNVPYLSRDIGSLSCDVSNTPLIVSLFSQSVTRFILRVIFRAFPEGNP